MVLNGIFFNMLIYKITNKINGKTYIGQTIRDFNERISEHKRCDKNGCPMLYKAIRKYGYENFKFEIICRASSLEELDRREEFCIRIFNTLVPNGYNLTSGGRNSKPSEYAKNE